MKMALMMITEYVLIGFVFVLSSKDCPQGARASPVESSKNFNKTQFFDGFANSTAQPVHGVSEPRLY